jgi:hypothetical protein
MVRVRGWWWWPRFDLRVRVCGGSFVARLALLLRLDLPPALPDLLHAAGVANSD